MESKEVGVTLTKADKDKIAWLFVSHDIYKVVLATGLFLCLSSYYIQNNSFFDYLIAMGVLVLGVVVFSGFLAFIALLAHKVYELKEVRCKELFKDPK